MLFISLSILTGVLAPLIVMTQEVILKYPAPHEGAELPTALSCHLHMAPDIKKLYFTIMGMIFYGITAIVSGAFLACTICKAMKVDLENYFIKDDFKNHVSVILAITWKKEGLNTRQLSSSIYVFKRGTRYSSLLADHYSKGGNAHQYSIDWRQ